MEIDIRKNHDEVTSIRYGVGDHVIINTMSEDIVIEDNDGHICVSGDDVQNLIKALEKAIDLGWVK